MIVKALIKYEATTWQSWAAFTCFAISVLSLGLGFILTTGWILNANRHPVLHGLGVTLLIVGIPILILGGHCLDLMETEKKDVAIKRGADDNCVKALISRKSA